MQRLVSEDGSRLSAQSKAFTTDYTDAIPMERARSSFVFTEDNKENKDCVWLTPRLLLSVTSV
jgi:hypothetical protein